jgi:hypothetical protein
VVLNCRPFLPKGASMSYTYPGDLTTVADVQQYLGQTTVASGSQAIIQSLITRVSTQFYTYVGRNILSGTYVEYYNGTGSQNLVLNNYPIIYVSGISINGHSINQSTNNGYVTGWNNDDQQIFVNNGICKGFRNVQVTYSAGYPSIPGDVEQSVIDYVGILYNKKNRPGVVSQMLEGMNDRYIGDLEGLPKSVREIWESYRTQFKW